MRGMTTGNAEVVCDIPRIISMQEELVLARQTVMSDSMHSKLTDRCGCIYTKISCITFSKIHIVTMLLRRHIRVYMCKPLCKELPIVTVCLIAYTVMLFGCVGS